MSGGLAGLLSHRAVEHPERVLLRFVDGETWTLNALDAAADAVAASLQGSGLRAGDRVVVQSRNTPLLPLLLLGAARAALVVVPANASYRSGDLHHVVTDSGARLLVCEDDLAMPASQGLGAAVPELGIATAAEVRAWVAGGGTPIPAEVDDSTLLSLQYTSGTTGSPKACMLTHGYWLHLGAVAAEVYAAAPDDVMLTAQAFTYLDPQWNLVAALHAGAELVVLPRFSASTFVQSLVEHRVSLLYLVGPMAVMLLRQPPSTADRAHRLRVVYCSGIPPELHADLEARWGAPWREAFGMTETGVDLVVPIEDAASVGTGDLGRPVPGKSVAVVGTDGVPLPDGEAGELVIGGTPMMLGYWGRPEATAQTLREGRLHTGDLAVRSADGRVRLVGRLKDMVRRGGENIAAAEVEAVLHAHPRVAAAGIVAVPDQVRGEEVAAIVVATPHVDGPPSPEALRSHVADRLAPFKVPRYVAFVDALPRTPSEKVDKPSLSALWPQLAPTAFDAVETSRESAHQGAGQHARPTDGPDVRVTVVDGVATLTLDRPEVLNAIRPRTLDDLVAALDAVAADPGVRVMVLTGAGRAFCSGQDLDILSEQLAVDDASAAGAARVRSVELLERFQDLTRALRDLPVPTIAALNGVAVGAGAELALACDLRVASDRARIGFVEAARGLFQTNGATWLLPRLIGMSQAIELLVTAELVDAGTAARLGLVTQVAAEADFPAAVEALARRISVNAPLPVRRAVALVRRTYELGLDEAMALEVEATADCLASEDIREGTRAFHERREPRYVGR